MMHPEIARQISQYRERDMLKKAAERREARFTRLRRRSGEQQDTMAIPPIPDYIDGTFRTVAVSGHRPVTAGRHAA